LPVTLEMLRESGVGRAMGKLRKSKKFGDRATAIVNKWKDLAHAPSLSFSHEQVNVVESEARERRAGKRSIEPDIVLEQKRMRPLPVLALEDIQPRSNVPPSHSSSSFIPIPSAEDVYDPSVFTRKMTNRDVIRKRGTITLVNGEVPRLFDMCVKTCIINIDAIEETGDIPFDILEPILKQCTEMQLARIESKNPHLKPDTDLLWRKHVHRLFPGNRPDDDEDEGWRECHARLTREQERRLKNISQRIKDSAVATSGPVRKTMEVSPITPKDARKKQINNGIYSSRDHSVPHAMEVSRARRQIADTGDDSDFKQLPLAVRNTAPTLSTTSSKKGPTQSKRASGMAKALRMLKGQPKFGR